MINGPTGVGKSWLACALGHKSCRDNRSVLYQRVPKLFGELALARGDGRYNRISRMARRRPTPDPRRLGPGAARRSGRATISWKSSKNAMAGDPPSSPASSRRGLARRHRRSHLCRRHPRPPRPQRSPPQPLTARACAKHGPKRQRKVDASTTRVPQNSQPARLRTLGDIMSESMGREYFGIPGRLRRNQQPATTES